MSEYESARIALSEYESARIALSEYESARIALSEYESARIALSEYGTKQCVEIFAYLIEGVYYVTFCCDRFIRQR